MMDIKYKYIVEETKDKIKQIVSIRNIKDKLYQLQLLDKSQYLNIEKVTNEESLDILFKNLSQKENAGQKCKNFVENILKNDYEWFYEELQNVLLNEDKIQSIYESVLNYGDFPRKPAHYVERSDKIKQVQEHLIKISTVGKIILCGMAGSGKTSLVMGVMTKEMVLDVFASNVFWVNVGDIDKEQILILLSKFYLKLCDETQENSINSFNSIDILKDKLKKKIRENGNNNHMLLVLDNVCSEDAINAFDIGCKVLITTQNKEVFHHGYGIKFIEIDGSFKYEETCSLFGKCLEKPVSYVQKIPEVQEIHRLCYGHPFSIALFGSQIATFKEKLLDSDSRKWKHFIKMLQTNFENQQENVITSCIETLDENIRIRYSDFAIFPEDVNISSKVLEILWDLDEFKVKEIMTQLENKSLIVSYYSNDQHNYVFGIHIVLLTYLKNKYENQLKKKHERLIEAYKRSCANDFSRLIDDNYIYQYIGYHLKQADLKYDFKIYFDLKFIGAKIKATGVGDILKDFTIYRNIIQDTMIGNDRSVVIDIENFIKKFGNDLHKHEDINIIQCALMYPKETYIYQLAMKTALSATSSLFLKIQTPQKKYDNYISEFSLPENCTYVCFARDENQLLIGTKEGNIEVWDRIYHKVLYKFVGHSQGIKYIEVDPDGKTFLSVSEDGLINIWTLHTQNLKQTPSLLQTNHRSFFGEETTFSPTYTFKPEENDHFVCGSFCNSYPHDPSIIIGSSKGVINLYKNGNYRLFHLKSAAVIGFLQFSEDDSIIIGTGGKELFILTKNFDEAIFKSMENPAIAIFMLEQNSFITLHNKSIYLWNFVSKKMPKDKLPDVNSILMDRTTGNTEFSCAFLENNVLYAVTTDYKIFTYNIAKLDPIKMTNAFDTEINELVTFADVYQFNNDSLFLFKYKNNFLKFYTPEAIAECNKRHTPIFDCYWGERQVRIVDVTPNNIIRISNNFNILNDIKKLESVVTVVCFSPCGDMFSYGMANGQVMEYEIKTNHARKVMTLHSSVLSLKYVGREQKDILVATGESGDLMVRHNDKNRCLITKTPISKFSLEPLIEVFYIDSSNSLLTVSKDRIIKMWNLTNDKMEVLKGPKQSNINSAVQMSAMSKDGMLLALTMANMFDVFLVDKHDGNIHLIDFGGDELDDELYSCNISHDNKYLAVGANSGALIIYDINMEKKVLYPYTTLHSHISTIKCIKFSPQNSSLLVSIGEQVVWWNLAKVTNHSIIRNRNSKRRSRLPNDELTISTENLLISHRMNSKVGSDNKPYLLRAVKFKGAYANTICVNPNFKTFVTKDCEGICYIIEMIE